MNKLHPNVRSLFDSVINLLWLHTVRVQLARFKKEYEGLTKIAPPFNLFIYMY